ncbi:MAG: trypsin-like peptidase domain-containing protein [bacterium]|nr:trypsin-like peptidase domain-containing protein [bacterium]MDE0500993.1 trypsin-like peptidase domain-containing protein [bacterium]
MADFDGEGLEGEGVSREGEELEADGGSTEGERLEQDRVSTEGVTSGEDPAEDPSQVETGRGPVESAASEPSRPSVRGSTLRGMGWKMMAAAGTALLLAGFVAGLFFPGTVAEDPVSEQVPVATTPETVTTTSAPTTTTPPATTAAPAPTTTATTQPVAEEVSPPDLVITDEPVADVADRLIPSVVHLEITSENIFEQGTGSGVIFDSQGYIFTAAHVVETVVAGEADLTVRLSNGDRLPGEVVGTDPDSDVAVVKVGRSGLTPAELALGQRLRVGQIVVAVGSPWGLVSSVTGGVISATDRILDGKLLIQSDAVLYPGNSGGALADRYGRLIGINVSIFTDSTTLEPVEFQGVGFAVPIDVAYRVAEALIAGEPVHTTFLGVSGRDSQGDAGVEIMEVFPGSGAETAGLMVGDVIVAVDDRPVTGISDLAARIRHRVPGDRLVLNIVRGDEELSLIATLLPRSEVMGDLEEEDQLAPEEEQEGDDDTP